MKRRTEILNVEGKSIEYSVLGEGIPILVMHGGHSNCYEEFGIHALAENGFSIIIPSRAGYGKTSKEIGENLFAACSYYSLLLQHLNINKVHLLAISAGGPSGIVFASTYPEQVITLTLQSAVTKEWLTKADKEYKAAQILFHPKIEKYTWSLMAFLTNKFPRMIFKQMASSFSTLAFNQIEKLMKEEDIEAIQKMNNRQRSNEGFLLDLSKNNMISKEMLQAISCPTLIMHSKNDYAVPMEHAENAHEHIPLANLIQLDTWGHLIWLGKGSEETDKNLLAFLKRNQISF